MARAIWSGSISFGLVNVPVKAYTAVRDHSVHFHQLERKSGARIRYEKVSEESGKEVASDDIELGYEVAKGRYVTVDPDEVEELRPRSTRSIAVSDFVNLSEIDPVYYDRTYWLAPDGEAAGPAYQLLEAAMEQAGRAGIGSVVMRNKQYLAAIRPLDGALAMSTMRFADEVVAKSSIEQLPSRPAKPGRKELSLAEQIIDSLTTKWDPSRYHDTYTEELEDLLQRKAKGEEIIVEPAPAQSAKVLDLMSALQASIAAAKKAKDGGFEKELERAATASAGEEEPRQRRRTKRPAAKKSPSSGSRSRPAAKKSASSGSRSRPAAKKQARRKSA